jgi:hypothetical protein
MASLLRKRKKFTEDQQSKHNNFQCKIPSSIIHKEVEILGKVSGGFPLLAGKSVVYLLPFYYLFV